jgi:YcxB-like protein
MQDDNNPYRTMPAAAREIEAARLVGQPMTVEFALTGDDYAAFNLHWQRTSEVVRQRLIKTWIVLASMTLAPALVSIATMRNDPGLAKLLAFVALLMLAWTISIAVSRRRRASRSLHNLFRNMTGRALVGHRVFTIRPDAIEVVSEVFTTTYKWIGIERIETDIAHAFLYQGSAAAMVVPKRAFDSEAHFQAFIETARQFQRQAAEADAKKA